MLSVMRHLPVLISIEKGKGEGVQGEGVQGTPTDVNWHRSLNNRLCVKLTGKHPHNRDA